jgi:hypothetical protein
MPLFWDSNWTEEWDSKSGRSNLPSLFSPLASGGIQRVRETVGATLLL